MRSMLSIFAALAATIQATPASAAQMTLGDLREICAATDTSSQMACRYYILGAFEGLSTGNAAEPPKGTGPYVERRTGRAFCVPSDLPDATMRATVLSMADADLKAFPEDAKMPAIAFIGAVITRSYPCL